MALQGHRAPGVCRGLPAVLQLRTHLCLRERKLVEAGERQCLESSQCWEELVSTQGREDKPSKAMLPG